MKRFCNTISNLVIYSLIFISIFFWVKAIRDVDYNIEYTDFSKDEIRNFITSNSIKLKDKKRITNVTMQQMIPSGCLYTIYYIDNNNDKQIEEIARKSETTFRDYIIEYGENLDEKYARISQSAFHMLIIVIIVKFFIIYIYNRKHNLYQENDNEKYKMYYF